jgi:hypothetical protein
MDKATLRQRLGGILSEEDHSNVDWGTVDRLCEELLQDVKSHADLECPHVVFHFLTDADIRAKDAVYGKGQRVEIKRFVETGECKDSKPLSPWVIIGTLAAIGVLVFGLLN